MLKLFSSKAQYNLIQIFASNQNIFWAQFLLYNLLKFYLEILKLFTTSVTTVWKFQDFSVIHILREIKFGECKSSKTEFSILVKFRASKSVKMGLGQL